MKIYIAARYSMKNIIKDAAMILEFCGFEIISDWHLEHHAPDTKIQDLTEEENFELALKDVTQIRDCDAMLFYSEHPDTATVRGGRHVEFGMALALGKPIFVYGHKENIFHYLPQVEHTENVVESLREYADKRFR